MLIRPWGTCYELLTNHTVEKYFLPIIKIVPATLKNLSDEDLKKESKTEAKNDTLSGIIKALKNLVGRTGGTEEIIKELEILRLEMILRLLQISSFSGKMNALNEVNKVLSSVAYCSPRHHIDVDEWLTADKMAEWINKHNVLDIVLRDSLHQPQYVEKLEKIIRFMTKEKTLTSKDLDRIWQAQAGKHEAIVKNVHELLAKLAWDFSADQLDHLFDCFQNSWTNASKKEREKLLELIRRLAEDDKEGVMANKVLSLLWSLAHSKDVPTETMEAAMNAHIKILDFSCSQDRDTHKLEWIGTLIDELKNNPSWTIPALKHIREICQLFSEAPQQNFNNVRTENLYYRQNIISELQSQHSIIRLVTNNLEIYVKKARQVVTENKHLANDPKLLLLDKRYDHNIQVQERLRFIRFLLKEGQIWLVEDQARQIWNCLAVNAVYQSDREACFKWFAKIMGDEQDLDPEISNQFFVSCVLELDSSLLTELGMSCFERFFKMVNLKEKKLKCGGKNIVMDSVDLIGLDYVWRVIMNAEETVASKAITLLKELYTNLSPSLQPQQLDLHQELLNDCMQRLEASADTVKLLKSTSKEEGDEIALRKELKKMTRILIVLCEYIKECDSTYQQERALPPLFRASRGNNILLKVRTISQHRSQGHDEFDIWTHDVETLASLRRAIELKISNRWKCSQLSSPCGKVELGYNGELLEPSIHDSRLISELGIQNRAIISAKLTNITGHPSSAESSSDSSPSPPHHMSTSHHFEGPTQEKESYLPGVILSDHIDRALFICKVIDLGCELQEEALRDHALQLLFVVPAHDQSVKIIKEACPRRATDKAKLSKALEEIFFNNPSHATVLYYVNILYSLLLPAQDINWKDSSSMRTNFLLNGGVQLSLSMLTRHDFMKNADIFLKRMAYLHVLRICKLVLAIVAHARVQYVSAKYDGINNIQQNNKQFQEYEEARILQDALTNVTCFHPENKLHNATLSHGQELKDKVIDFQPDLTTAKVVQKIAWCASWGVLHLSHTIDDSEKTLESSRHEPNDLDVKVSCEALELLSLVLALCPRALESFNKDKQWQTFILDVLLVCPVSDIRNQAQDYFFNIATKCVKGQKPLQFFVTLLFTALTSQVPKYSNQSQDYFILLCKLLNESTEKNVQFTNADVLLQKEINWLEDARKKVTKDQEEVDQVLLQGHLMILRSFLLMDKKEKKEEIGADSRQGVCLIRKLVEDFIFPASKYVALLKDHSSIIAPITKAVCHSSMATSAAFNLLVALCEGSVKNLELLSKLLTAMYYSDKDSSLTDWEYVPAVGRRPTNGFVGLKNAGATCYMNSVLQQLFMTDPIRRAILEVNAGGEDDIPDDFDEDEDVQQTKISDEKPEEQQKTYHLGVLRHIQHIFGHLSKSDLQYHVPKRFWKHFRLQGEPLNLREQQDALEFLASVADSIDEAMKAIGAQPIISKVMGGAYADQKICKGCPHRYSRSQSFLTLNIDIRNQHNLLESLEQYVKGDLLEGANAYHCERCDKKVDTVKRMCIKKLPPILAIQLKRFDYDWERDCAVKFNDYFEFPQQLDMEPYTVHGLARMEGEAVVDEESGAGDENANSQRCTKYRLVGMVVHSGQASGGHYFSYILHRVPGGFEKWYKFDDGDVTECRMDDEELRNQCFGGEYLGEVFDHMLKRMSYRRQKRWWNAYILLYERIDQNRIMEGQGDVENISRSLASMSINEKMPSFIEQSVRRHNLQFMHQRAQFCPEYFHFVRSLVQANVITPCPIYLSNSECEELAMLSVQLAAKFLFTVGFRTKKSLRGSANDWYDAFAFHLRTSKNVRLWFIEQVLLQHPSRFSEYLLECPSIEVRQTFMKILVFLAHCSRNDGNRLVDGKSYSDLLIAHVLSLLKRQVSENGRHLAQYFQLFVMYAQLGREEKEQLLRHHVPTLFITVALDEGPGPPIKYQYTELGKLYTVVSVLIRCYDVKAFCRASDGSPVNKPNPYADEGGPIQTITSEVSDMLYQRQSIVKKVVEDCQSSEDIPKLLLFCSWENESFSTYLISELVWQVAFSYTYELRPYLDLIMNTLLIQDSFQTQRIMLAFRGVPEDRDGLFGIIHKSKSHYQKRGYQIIKMMVQLFHKCPASLEILSKYSEFKKKWHNAVDWLNEELERKPYQSHNTYAWSPPAQSNETSNGYFLERSNSAKITLQTALQVLPDEDMEDCRRSPSPKSVSKSKEKISAINAKFINYR